MSSSGVAASGTMYLPVKQVTNARFFPQGGSMAGPGTSVAMGNGTLRVSPGYIVSPVTVSQLGAEITVVGDVGSTLLLTVYRDAGLSQFLYPGALESSGAIPADATAVAEVDVADFTLGVGWHWFGGVVQGVTVTQPTVRTIVGNGVVGLVNNAAPGTAGTYSGYTSGSQLGAPPDPFPAFANNISGTMPRMHLRLA